jgi:hypothetical protein
LRSQLTFQKTKNKQQEHIITPQKRRDIMLGYTVDDTISPNSQLEAGSNCSSSSGAFFLAPAFQYASLNILGVQNAIVTSLQKIPTFCMAVVSFILDAILSVFLCSVHSISDR